MKRVAIILALMFVLVGAYGCRQTPTYNDVKPVKLTAKDEAAVVKGLDWLQKNQNKDGSWGSGHKSAMTGLALLAYLGHCETPLSEKYGDTVLRGMVYLTDLGMKNHGKLVPKGGEKDKHWPYQHSIATYALAEGLAETYTAEVLPTVGRTSPEPDPPATTVGPLSGRVASSARRSSLSGSSTPRVRRFSAGL